VVPEHKEGPVKEPRALLQLLLVAVVARVNGCPELFKLGEGEVPLGGVSLLGQQNERRELAPQGLKPERVRRHLVLGHHQKVGQHGRSHFVLPALVLKLGALVVGRQGVRPHAQGFLQPCRRERRLLREDAFVLASLLQIKREAKQVEHYMTK